jgi:hypothetical protein
MKKLIPSNSGLTFLFRKEEVTKETRTVLVAEVKTSLFAKIPAALCLLTKLAENFLTLINRLLPTHCAMVQEKRKMLYTQNIILRQLLSISNAPRGLF